MQWRIALQKVDDPKSIKQNISARFFYMFYAYFNVFLLSIITRSRLSSVGFENVNIQQIPTEHEYLTFKHEVYTYKEYFCVIKGELNAWINTLC